MQIRYFFIVALVSLVGSSGCLLPPTTDRASVLTQPELEVISLLKRGKDYSLSGRGDLAEVQFRYALKRRPDMDSIYNDLGYVLQSQERLDEAQAMYEKALELQPKNIVARENLARVLYRLGKLREALIQYLTLSDLVFRLDSAELTRLLGQEFGQQDLVSIYRNVATIYYFLGAYDEAVCYSWLAHLRSATEYQAGQHVRLLFSLNMVDVALRTVKDVVIAKQGNVTSQTLLDYGTALYLTGETALAKVAVTRVLSMPATDPATRRLARLIRLSIAQSSNNTKEAESLRAGIREEDTDLCKTAELDPEQYWPYALHENVQAMLTQICSEPTEQQ